MMNIFWIFAVLATGALLPGFDFKVNTAITLIVGSLIFQAGFATTTKGQYHDSTLYIINPTTLKWLVIILLPIFAYSLNSLYESMKQNAMYEALTGKSMEVETIGGYFAKIIQYLSILYIILFNRPENESIKKKIKPYVFILITMGFITALMNATRNGMLFFFLPFVVAWLNSRRTPPKKQLRYLGIGLLLFLVYYAYISFYKYAWQYDKGNSSDILLGEINHYLSGSILAFDNFIDTHAFTRMGENTFRFFLALSDKLSGTHSALRLANEFEVAYNIETNVFTFYDFYLRDFGILFALFMQFVVACIHGIAYKKNSSVAGLFFFSMLTYPLVMQFFQDQYFSLFSTWLQITIVCICVLKTSIFVHKSYLNN